MVSRISVVLTYLKKKYVFPIENIKEYKISNWEKLETTKDILTANSAIKTLKKMYTALKKPSVLNQGKNEVLGCLGCASMFLSIFKLQNINFRTTDKTYHNYNKVSHYTWCMVTNDGEGIKISSMTGTD